jgi:hypothetical protein
MLIKRKVVIKLSKEFIMYIVMLKGGKMGAITLSIMTLSITTFSIITLSIKGLFATLHK